MKRSGILKRTAAIAAFMLLAVLAGAQERDFDYVFFRNAMKSGMYPYSEVQYSGYSWVKNGRRHLFAREEQFSSPGNSLELTYKSNPAGNWTVSIAYPEIRGVEQFSKPYVLSMHVKGELNANIRLTLAGGRKTPGIDLAQIERRDLGDGWQEVRVPFSKLVSSGSLSKAEDPSAVGKTLDAGLVKAVELYQNERCDDIEHTAYIDDIEILGEERANASVRKDAPVITEALGFERHIDLRWTRKEEDGVKYFKIYRSLNGGDWEAVAVKEAWSDRYADFIGEVGARAQYKVSAVGYDGSESRLSKPAEAATREMTDEQLLDMLQLANFRYYWEGCEPNSGLAREDIPGHTDMIAAGASGFGMMSILVGIHRGFITREQGVERFLRITEFLSKAQRHHGVYPHFMNGKTGETIAWFGKKDNGGDLVETAFMYEGLIAALQFFDADNDNERTIRERISRIWEETEWDWYRKTPDSDYLYWHWSPDQEWVINHRLIGWNETLVTYFLAIASPTHGVPAELYYSGWASQSDLAANYRSWAVSRDGNRYVNGNAYYGQKLEVGESTGGPLFFCHYSFLGLDPRALTDRYCNYFQNNKAIATINYRYCVENPKGHEGYGEDAWGLTASDGFWGYCASEPATHIDEGKITPTGALASFPYTPEESMRAFKHFYRDCGAWLWGEFGFYDAYNPGINWVAPIFMGLNQGPITVMVENYRSGFVWDLFMSNPDVQNAIKKLEAIR